MAHEKASDRQTEEVLEKYSVFSAAEKWCIVAMVSYAAWFSTLTSFIYYPAIHQLAQTFAVSVESINLTITSYLAVATIAPTLLGDAADVLGRRPVYVLALSLYIGANIAIVLSNSYAALVGLRVLQALAISGLCMQLDFSIYNTLLVDKNYETPAAAQASSNIQIVNTLGIGWTFTLMSGLCLMALGLFVLDYRKGTAWRQKSMVSSSLSAD
ncbi:MAG: hypothetical protein Q9182_004629 [Xanthomendoza sp. 2 TL-2023]